MAQINLAAIAKQAAGVKEPVAKPKTNQIDVTVFLDGREVSSSFHVPLTMTLTAGEKSDARLRELVATMLRNRFGKVEPIP